MKSLGGFHELDALGYVSVAIFLRKKFLEAKKTNSAEIQVSECVNRNKISRLIQKVSL